MRAFSSPFFWFMPSFLRNIRKCEKLCGMVHVCRISCQSKRCGGAGTCYCLLCPLVGLFLIYRFGPLQTSSVWYDDFRLFCLFAIIWMQALNMQHEHWCVCLFDVGFVLKRFATRMKFAILKADSDTLRLSWIEIKAFKQVRHWHCPIACMLIMFAFFCVLFRWRFFKVVLCQHKF
jgi:hypothetical protein